MYGKLRFEIFKIIELVGGIKVFVILSVRVFNFTVLPWRTRINEFMSGSQLPESRLESRESALLAFFEFLKNFISLSVSIHSILNGNALVSYLQELSGRTSTLFFKCNNETGARKTLKL